MTKVYADGDNTHSAMNILLVEDDSGLRRQMQWALNPYQTIPAGTAPLGFDDDSDCAAAELERACEESFAFRCQ